MKATATFVASLFAAALFAQDAESKPAEELTEKEDKALEVSFSLDLLSDYVWRGQICNDNPVWQPAVSLDYDTGDFGKLGLDFWSSQDFTHKRGTSNTSRRGMGCQEIDYTLRWGYSLKDVEFEIGHIFYTYPNNNGHSDQDLYASVAYNNDYVTPSAAVYWNYSDSANTDPSAVYFTFGLSHEFEVTDKFKVAPQANLGFGDHAMTDSAGGTELTDQTVGVSATYAITDYLSVGGQLNYTWTPSHTLRHEDYMGRGKDQLLWGGINVTLSF